MPEIDAELARLIGLGLLAILVLLLLAILGSLGRLRKSVESASAARAEPPAAQEPQPETIGAPAPEPEPVQAAPEPEPVQAAPEPLEAAAPTETVEPERAETPAVAEPSPAVQHPEPVYQEPVTPEPEPVAAQPEPQPAATAVEEPQEQPFERDGRWWFRRGDELLVYNDASGQWEPAPVTAAGTEQAAPAQTQEQQGFWKCPSCGAVNGSTATSCRMCFTARP